MAFTFCLYLLGWQVLWSAFRNCLRGQIFDENFLMAVATLGAAAIGELPEAVGVMLFIRWGKPLKNGQRNGADRRLWKPLICDQIRCGVLVMDK